MSKKILVAILYILLVQVLLSFSHVSATQKMARIIGGRAANPNAWPWMSGLVYKHDSIVNGPFCGASLIAKDWVLTAAHCVINKSSASFDVFINQAQLDGDKTVERLNVDYFITHPLFDHFSLENDLALIKLESPSQIQPIQVFPPFTSQDKPAKQAIALGWGSTSVNLLHYPLNLQQVDLPIISNSLCAARMGSITDGMVCAGSGLGNKDTCFGDSGGPLVIFDTESGSWRQAGITSWGFGCAEPGFYGVYTRLKHYARFISDHICASPESLPPVTLKLDIDGTLASANWNALKDAAGYRLNYAPYPEAENIYSIDMNRATDYSVRLATNSAYYVAISSYNGNCLSEYSNIENFIIKE